MKEDSVNRYKKWTSEEDKLVLETINDLMKKLERGRVAIFHRHYKLWRKHLGKTVE